MKWKTTQVRKRDLYAWLFSFLRTYRTTFLLTLIMGAVITAIELLLPKSLQILIDRAIPDHDSGLLLRIFAVLAVLVVLSIVLSIKRSEKERRMHELVTKDVVVYIYEKVRKMGFSYFEEHPVGETIGLLQTETDAMLRFYRELLPNAINAGLFSIIAIGMMSSISVQLTLVLFPALLLYFLAGKRLDRKVSKTAKDWSDQRVQLSQSLYETISAQLDLRTNAAESWGNRRSEEVLAEHNRTMRLSFNYSNARRALRRLAQFSGAIAVILYAVYLLRSGYLTVGEASAFFVFFFTAMQNITAFIVQTSELTIVLKQVQRLYDLHLAVPDVQEPAVSEGVDKAAGHIRLDDVVFAYKDKPPVLNGITLDIPAGQRVALVGYSGEGKSTLLKLIPRFYDPQRGMVSIDGSDVRNWSFRQLRQNIGIVFQEVYLFGASVKENIRIGKPDASDEEIIAAAKAAAAHEFIMGLPQGYDTPVNERGVILSGGQKQRISLARLFLKAPAIILLDEATASLDNVNEAEVTNALKRWMKGRTTLTVAHRISTIADYDRIAFIRNGSITEIGTYEQLMALEGEFAALVRGQAGEESA